MSFQPNKDLMLRVDRAAPAMLARDGRLSDPAILGELGILTTSACESWRAGRVPYLEKVIRSNLTKRART